MTQGSVDAATVQRLTALEALLRHESLSAHALASALSVSQPTLSRTIQSLPDTITSFRIPGNRTPQYGLLRKLPRGLLPRQPVYRVSSSGSIEHFAALEFLSGGATLERLGNKATLYGGLPPYLVFASPSGFLGRQMALGAAAAMQLPVSLKDWGDEHRTVYLFNGSFNLAGNLVYGDVSLEHEMQFRQVPAISVDDKLAHYVGRATDLKETSYGSSAGGEQPKFLSLVADAGHVIVKFAKRGSRMAQLLPLEHLALRLLEEVDVPAASSNLLVSDDYVFLEVQRFDRIGRHGRVGLLSAGAIDDEFFGVRDTWSDFAARCEHAKYLSSADARRIDVMAAFSELIGNGDRHFENISVLVGDDGQYRGVAPAYDILPMRYASIGGGLDPDLTPVTPKVGTIGAKPAVWARAAVAARRFWQAVQDNLTAVPMSDEFRALAAKNLVVVDGFVAPLLPAGDAGG